MAEREAAAARLDEERRVGAHGTGRRRGERRVHRLDRRELDLGAGVRRRPREPGRAVVAQDEVVLDVGGEALELEHDLGVGAAPVALELLDRQPRLPQAGCEPDDHGRLRKAETTFSPTSSR